MYHESHESHLCQRPVYRPHAPTCRLAGRFSEKAADPQSAMGALPCVLEGCLFLLAAGLIIGGLLALFCGLG